MRQKHQWIEVMDFNDLVAAVIEESPDRYGQIVPGSIVAYASPTHPTLRGNRACELTGEADSASFVDSKQYYVRLSLKDWFNRTAGGKRILVASILDRIAPDHPGWAMART